MQEFFNQYITNQPLIRILDIIIVWYVVYRLLKYAQGTQMMNLLKGVGIFIVAKFISASLGLHTVDWLLGQILSWGVVAIIILFQPELRRALEIIGRDLFRNRRESKNISVRLIDDLERSAIYMSKRKIGALISVEGEDELSEYIDTGIQLKAQVSSQLLINIFTPNTPLHDGAVIIKDYSIASASSYLPLSESSEIPKDLGTRHRAAIGLGEVTDALTIIVSEETGDISLVHGENLHRALSTTDFRELLEEYLYDDDLDDDKDYLQIMKDFINEAFSRGGSNES